MASEIHPETTSQTPRQLLMATALEKPTANGNQKAKRAYAADVPEKQLHRWMGEGGALLPDEYSNSDSNIPKQLSTV